MASVWKRENSKYFTGCWTDETGKQRKRSTKTVTRSKAEEIVRGWQLAAHKAREGILIEAQARKIVSEIMERTTGESIRAVNTRKYFQEWQNENDALTSKATAARYRNLTNKFLTHLGPKADKPLDAIGTKDIQSFVNDRLNAGRSAKTVTVDAKSIAAAFNRAHRRGLLLHNPASGVALPKRVVSSKRDTFTAAQVKMLLKEAPSIDWKTVIMLAYHIGARLGDCVRMKTSSVNLTAGVIGYYPRKTDGQSEEDGKLTVPIPPDLEAHLLSLMGSDKPEEEFLCPTLADKSVGGAHGLSATFIKIMRAAGLDPQKGPGKGKRQFSKLSFHSLRHTFNSQLANAGVNQETRMKLTGHKSESVNAGYTHHEMETLRRAIRKLPSVAGNQLDLPI